MKRSLEDYILRGEREDSSFFRNPENKKIYQSLNFLILSILSKSIGNDLPRYLPAPNLRCFKRDYPLKYSLNSNFNCSEYFSKSISKASLT